MDFSALPPEINSARMYSGPGSGPMMTAATAWDGLATELHSTVASYSSVISGLTSQQWLGPSSASMAAAAGRYAAWMSTTAAQVEQVAAQAKAATVVYEAALATTVHPGVIAANRSQLMSLVRTNILGQNTAAIAATEANYGEMWAQDVVAMNGYAALSAAVSALPAFTLPPDFFDIVELIFFAILDGLEALAGVSFVVSAILQALALSLGGVINYAETPNESAGSPEAPGHEVPPEELPSEEPNMFRVAGAGVMPESGPSGAGLAVGGGMGRAISVGGLSAPQTWAVSPAVRPLVSVSPNTGVGAAPLVADDSSDDSYIGVALAGLVGSSMAGLAGRGGSSADPAATTPAASAAGGAAARPAARPAAIISASPVTTPAASSPAGGGEDLATALATAMSAVLQRYLGRP